MLIGNRPLIANYSCSEDTPKGQYHLQDNLGWWYTYWTFGGLTAVLFIVRFCIRLYETPKYLLGKGKDEKAVEVVQKVAKRNGKTTWLTVAHFEAIDAQLQALQPAPSCSAVPTATSTAILNRKLSKWAPHKVLALSQPQNGPLHLPHAPPLVLNRHGLPTLQQLHPHLPRRQGHKVRLQQHQRNLPQLCYPSRLRHPGLHHWRLHGGHEAYRPQGHRDICLPLHRGVPLPLHPRTEQGGGSGLLVRHRLLPEPRLWSPLIVYARTISSSDQGDGERAGSGAESAFRSNGPDYRGVYWNRDESANLDFGRAVHCGGTGVLDSAV